MKFLDLNFVIFIGITVVIYFIYKEIEILRNKTLKIEENTGKYDIAIHRIFTHMSAMQEELNSVKSLPRQSQESAPHVITKLSETSESDEVSTIEYIVSSKQSVEDRLHVPSKQSVEPVLHIPSKQSVEATLQVMQKKSSNSSLTSLSSSRESSQKNIKIEPFEEIKQDNNSESDSEMIDESQHLAIYSNDNENFDETQHSLLETSDTQTNLKFDYEVAGVNVPNLLVASSKPTSPVANSPVASIIDYDMMKLVELKKIAETKNIVLTKKVGGVNKPKTKKDLIDDLLKL